MKKLLVTLGLVVAMAAIPPQPKAQVVPVPVAVVGLLIIGVVGAIVVNAVVRMMRNCESNQIYWQTNSEARSPLPPMGMADYGCNGGGAGRRYQIESSSNLTNWNSGMVVWWCWYVDATNVAHVSATAVQDGRMMPRKTRVVKVRDGPIPKGIPNNPGQGIAET